MVKKSKSGLIKKGKNKESKSLPVPEDFLKILLKNELIEKFEGMAYTHKKEYVLWITGAKKEETRLSRLNKAVEMIKKGKKEL